MKVQQEMTKISSHLIAKLVLRSWSRRVVNDETFELPTITWERLRIPADRYVDVIYIDVILD